MARIFLVSDATTVLDDLRAALEDDDNDLVELRSGPLVRPAVAEDPPDLVIADSQIGSMGAMAICMDLRLEESGSRAPHIPFLMLVDRRADIFLANRSDAEGYLVKPLDPIRLQRATKAILEGGSFHDESFKPRTEVARS